MVSGNCLWMGTSCLLVWFMGSVANALAEPAECRVVGGNSRALPSNGKQDQSFPGSQGVRYAVPTGLSSISLALTQD